MLVDLVSNSIYNSIKLVPPVVRGPLLAPLVVVGCSSLSLSILCHCLLVLFYCSLLFVDAAGLRHANARLPYQQGTGGGQAFLS